MMKKAVLTSILFTLVCSMFAQLAPVKGVKFQRDYAADTLVGVQTKNSNASGVAGYKMIMGTDTAYIALWSDSLVIWSDGEIYMQPEMSITKTIRSFIGENVTTASFDGAGWLYGESLTGSYSAVALGDLTNLGRTDDAFVAVDLDTSGTTEQTTIYLQKGLAGISYQINASLPAIGMVTDTTGTDLYYRRSADTTLIQADRGIIRLQHIDAPNLMTATVDSNFAVTSTTGALIVPRMTTAQRDALTAVNGMLIYNNTTNEFNVQESGGWQPMATTGSALTMMQMGEIWSETETTITGSDSDTTLVNNATTLTASPPVMGNWDSPSNGRLRYTGTNTLSFHCGVTVSFKTSAGNNQEVMFEIRKNGTKINGSKVLSTGDSGEYHSTAIHIFTQMATNDYLEIWTINNSGTNTVVVNSFNLFTMSVE